MAFDIYVGSFTRYITGDWENAGQRAAREQGIEYQIVRDNMTEEAPPPPDEVRAAVADWLLQINEGLGEHLGERLAWDESDAAPYFTERPDWNGYAAVLLLAAYDDHPELDQPELLPEEWGEDPAYLASTGDEAESHYPTLLHADLWLPGEFEFMFGVEDLGDNPRGVASTRALLEELRELNEATFQGSQADLDRWRAAPPPDGAPLVAHARFGLAVLMAMAEEAVRTGLPLMPDY